MRKKTAGLAALICAAGLISVTQTDTVLADGGFSYEDVANREFLFCSGAGAWSTVLTIHEDGTFEGYSTAGAARPDWSCAGNGPPG